jgi:hypothetical protein
MGRGVTKEARVMSTNFVDFKFPYDGPQQAKLILMEFAYGQAGCAEGGTRPVPLSIFH